MTATFGSGIRRKARLAGLVTAAIIAGSSATASQAVAAICGHHQMIADYLAARFNEKRESTALSHSGMLLEIYVSPSRTWTVVLSSPDGIACVLDAGEAWDGAAAAPGRPERGA